MPATEAQASTKQLNRSIRAVHNLIAAWHVATVIYFFVVTIWLLPVYHTVFFRVTAPVTVIGPPVKQEGVVVYICVFIVITRVLRVTGDRVMIAVSNCKDEDLQTRFGLAWLQPMQLRMLLRAFTDVMDWLNDMQQVIFVKSQLSFFLSMSIVDVVMVVITTHVMLRIERIMDYDFWREYLPQIAFLQLASAPFYIVTLYLTGAQSVGYFTPGPPITIFGNLVSDNTAYALITVVVFLDQFGVTLVKANVDSFFEAFLCDTATTPRERLDEEKEYVRRGQIDPHLVYASHESLALSAVRTTIDWVRTVFIYRFVFQQYFFVIIYICATVLASVSWEARKYSYKNKTDSVFLAKFPPGGRLTIRTLLVLQILELIAIIIILTTSGYDVTSYFTFNNPLFFGEHLNTHTRQAALISLTVLMCIAQTLYDCVITPDYYNYTYNNDNRLVSSEYKGTGLLTEIIRNTTIAEITKWICFLFSVQLITGSSVKFVVIMMAVNIPLKVLIMYFFIRYHARMLNGIEFVHLHQTCEKPVTRHPNGQKHRRNIVSSVNNVNSMKPPFSSKTPATSDDQNRNGGS